MIGIVTVAITPDLPRKTNGIQCEVVQSALARMPLISERKLEKSRLYFPSVGDWAVQRQCTLVSGVVGITQKVLIVVTRSAFYANKIPLGDFRVVSIVQ